MLLRAIASLDTVKEVLSRHGVGQPEAYQEAIVARAVDPESRDVLTLNVCPEDWDALSSQLQATPDKVDGDENCYRNNHLSDAIWLSEHDGQSVRTGFNKFDLFLHREA